MNKPILIDLIRSAFIGVTREGGVSWRETFRHDVGELGWEDARWNDDDRDWWEVAMSDSWEPDRGIGGWNFLDPIGMRYYLPAGMVWELWTGYDANILFQLKFSGIFVVERRPFLGGRWRPEHLKLLDDNQMKAVAAFVFHQSLKARENRTLIEAFNWEGAYRSFWKKWNKNNS